MVTAEQAVSCLEQINDAGSGRPVMELGWIDQVRVMPPRVVFRLTLPGFAQSQRERIAGEARHLLTQLDGIEDVQIEVGQPPSQGSIGQAGHGQPALEALFPLLLERLGDVNARCSAASGAASCAGSCPVSCVQLCTAV